MMDLGGCVGEAVIAYFLSGGTEESHEKLQIRIAGLRVKNRICNTLNMKQESTHNIHLMWMLHLSRFVT
jgi:hypothetical protein